MKKNILAVAAIALIGLGLPALASAATFTYVCEASTEPAPAGWFGGPWTAPVRVVVDTSARTVEVFDGTNLQQLGGTMPPARLAGLNNYQLDVNVTDDTISWGIIEMWGFSGYLDRKSGRVHLIWTNPRGYSADTLSRQFHGTCKER